jgi:signal transduction histidine kinase
LIADQVIEGMGFTDCVIYLADQKEGNLEQKAAYGPKNPKGRIISDRISIVFGEGIVGNVAEKGQAERIVDTRNDPRYIIDDDMCLSELTVPIMLKGHCLGVIDSEHHEVGFYTREHEEMLTTIASMEATKINDATHEQKLSSTIRDLEQTRSELIAQRDELHIARTVADSANLAKSQFLSTISHEMRTPMNSVIGIAELLQDTQLNAEQMEYLSNIQLSANALMGMINQLLDLAALDQGKLGLEQVYFNPSKLINNALKPYREICQTRVLELEYRIDNQVPVKIVGDTQRISELLSYLVDNASRFTERGGIVIVVSVESQQKEGFVDLQIEVRDSGTGIPG